MPKSSALVELRNSGTPSTGPAPSTSFCFMPIRIHLRMRFASLFEEIHLYQFLWLYCCRDILSGLSHLLEKTVLSGVACGHGVGVFPCTPWKSWGLQGLFCWALPAHDTSQWSMRSWRMWPSLVSQCSSQWWGVTCTMQLMEWEWLPHDGASR